MSNFPTYRKFVTALVGAVTVAVSQGLLPEEAARWASVAIAFLTAAGVYATQNEPQD